MKNYVLILFTLISLSAIGQVRYLEDGTPVVVSEQESISFDSLAKVAKSISYWEERLALNAIERAEIQRSIRELRKEGARLGEYQENLDITHNTSVISLSKYGDKDILIQFTNNRIRCMEITGYAETYNERQEIVSDSLITVVDTILTPELVNLGRVRMKSPYSFTFDNSSFIRIKTRRGRLWVKEDDRTVFFK